MKTCGASATLNTVPKILVGGGMLSLPACYFHFLGKQTVSGHWITGEAFKSARASTRTCALIEVSFEFISSNKGRVTGE